MLTNSQYRIFALSCVVVGAICILLGFVGVDTRYIIAGIGFFALPFLYRLAVVLAQRFGGASEPDEIPTTPPPPPEDAPDARWASMDELKAGRLLGKDRVLKLGRTGDRGEMLGLRHQGHVISFCPDPMMAQNNIVVPHLLVYEGSMVVTDPDGSLFRLTARRRRAMGQRVVVIDPLKKATDSGQSNNPLQLMPDEHVARMEMAAHIADFLLAPDYLPGAPVKTRRQARSLLQNFIVYMLMKNTKDRHTFADLARLINVPSHKFSAILQEMISMKTVDGKVENTAFELIDVDEEARAEIVSGVRQAVRCFETTSVATSASTTDLPMETLLLQGNVTVYLVGGDGGDKSLLGYMRAQLGSILLANRGAQLDKAKGPGLLVLNSMAEEIGRFRQMERFWCDRSFPRISMWHIYTGPGGLLDSSENWEHMAAQTDAIQVQSAAGTFDADWVSRLLGISCFEAQDISTEGPKLVPPDSKPVLSPQEVARLPEDTIIVFAKGVPPIQAKSFSYQSDPEFDGLYDTGSA